jgi:hypothetical protein
MLFSVEEQREIIENRHQNSNAVFCVLFDFENRTEYSFSN